MPDELDRTTVTSWFIGPFEVQQHRPECVTAIGLVLISWNFVEDQLAMSVAGILGVTISDEGGFSINNDWAMSIVMQETRMVSARVDIADAILSKGLEGSELLADWKELRKRLKIVGEERNAVVHTAWCWSDQAAKYVLQIKKSGKIYGWTQADFSRLAERVNDLRSDLHNFMIRVATAFRSGALQSDYLVPKRAKLFWANNGEVEGTSRER